ncbi:hypothetical protein C2G38_2244050 [Gigaspora rosea]|uniref:Uncharacterized protein n=1 Tax=Gigaspora rosea TaxID=44941 RepID=A0A397VFI9_9GLOM|nr:hypothetical protein C2G38_2244050 [Gigaspora rosea]
MYQRLLQQWETFYQRLLQLCLDFGISVHRIGHSEINLMKIHATMLHLSTYVKNLYLIHFWWIKNTNYKSTNVILIRFYNIILVLVSLIKIICNTITFVLQIFT